MLRHVSIIRSSSWSCLFLAKITLFKIFTPWFSYNSELFILKLLKMLRHVLIIWSSSESCLFLAKITLFKTITPWFSYNSELFILRLLKMLRHVSIIRSSSGSCLFLAKITLFKTFSPWFSHNSEILARNRQLHDDDRMIETCQSIFKSFNINNLTVWRLTTHIWVVPHR